MNTTRPIYLILFAVLVLLGSCDSKLNFRRSKEGTNKGLTSIESITNYSLRFNPKANGTIIVTLSNGAEYTAEKLNSTQVSSLVSLLGNKELKYDTENEEFLLNP